MATNTSALRGNPSAQPGAALTAPGGRIRATLGATADSGKLGVLFPLLLVWLFFEFGRPSNPFLIPLIISSALFLGWIFTKDKQWSRQSPWWFVLLAAMAIGIPFAPNTYAAFWASRDMAVLFLTICLPLQAMITSMKRIRLWVYTLLAVAIYVGGWGATHGGYGPSAAGGGQDENYVAAFMCVAIAFSYFMLFAEKRRIIRVVLVSAIVVFVAAMALAENPSRGGFLGLCAVALYCLWRSPRKALGIGIFAVIAIALVVIAGPGFWTEIATTTDTTTGTGDIRLELWKMGLRMWQANPIIGVGAGNFRWVIADYQSAEQLLKFGRSMGGSAVAHSMWVEGLAELGLAGVLAAAVLVVRTWTGLGNVRNDAIRLIAGSSKDPELVRIRCYADAIRAAILAVLINGLFLSLFYFSYIWLLLALGAGFTYMCRSRGLAPPSSDPPSDRVRSAVPRRGGVIQPALASPQSLSIRSRGRR